MSVLMKSETSSKMGYVASKTRSVGQILEKRVYALETTFQPNNYETWSECLSWLNLGWAWKWVMWGQKLGS